MAKFLILAGDGLNCQRETAQAVEMAQAQAEVRPLGALKGKLLGQYQGIIFPGGFSFGDELGPGKVLALKVARDLGGELEEFLAKGYPVLGICNGMQALVHLGLWGPGVALVENQKGAFINRWVELEVRPSPCLWLKGLEEIFLPARNKDGRLVGEVEESLAPLRYKAPVNGSVKSVAGLCNAKGNLLGMMPHPEAALFSCLHPDQRQWKHPKGPLGLKLFQNAVEYLQ